MKHSVAPTISIRPHDVKIGSLNGIKDNGKDRPDVSKRPEREVEQHAEVHGERIELREEEIAKTTDSC